MERSYRYAAFGAAIAAAAWLASRAAKRLMNPEPYPPRYPAPRPLPPAQPPVQARPGPAHPVQARPVETRPVQPARPVQPTSAGRAAEVKERMESADAVVARLRAPEQTIEETEIDELTTALAKDIRSAARPGEDLVATALRSWRELDAEANRRWPGADVIRRAGDLAWKTVFLAPDASGDHLQLAEWTRHRNTGVVTNERIGTDELLVRLAIAQAVMRPDTPSRFDQVIELWRRGVVADMRGNAVIAQRNGAEVARAVIGPRPPERGVA